MKWPLLLFAFLLTACSTDKLTLYTQYITPARRASCHVFSPDPKRNCPDVGQRLYLKWNIPKEWEQCPDLHIRLQIRFRNREQVEKWLAITKPRGMTIYELYNDEYFRTCGILSFKADLMSGDEILTEWRHQLWVDLIELNADDQTDEEEEEK